MARKQDFYKREIWPRWRSHFRQTDSRVVFLHGIMGGELYDHRGDDVRWIDWGEIFGREVDDLEFDRLTSGGGVDCGGQFIYASSTVNPPVVEPPYARILHDVKATPYCFDWRDSISVEASMLQLFLQLLDPDGGPINFLTHSMGGCLLLRLLGSTTEFDDRIGAIVFCAPPFRGALKPLRVIEDGDGTPIDRWIRDRVVRQSAATMPGLFQMLVAPRDLWPNNVEDGNQVVTNLNYPVRDNASLYSPTTWTNRQRPELRATVLRWARLHHEDVSGCVADVVDRLGDKIHVFVGLNGKTACTATRAADGEWVLHRGPEPERTQLSNGDGTVLLQSSILPGLPTGKYRALIPDQRQDTHLPMMDSVDLIEDVRSVFGGGVPSRLTSWEGFIGRIDWRGDQPGREPASSEGLSYQERVGLRSRTPPGDWGPALNPKVEGLGLTDMELFEITRAAALGVTKGDDLETASRRIGQTPEFLENHIRALLLPALHG